MRKFVIYQDKAVSFRWKLVSANGRITADSGEGYSTRSNATAAARKLGRYIHQNWPIEVDHI